MIGNLYHHMLLRNLRSQTRQGGVKQYYVPRGGLFEFVACPHYLFEILTFLGAACMTQAMLQYVVKMRMLLNNGLLKTDMIMLLIIT